MTINQTGSTAIYFIKKQSQIHGANEIKVSWVVLTK
jgi:hypothetical protein